MDTLNHDAQHVAPGESTRHRPDLDGLRAIAVLAVVLFHAGIPFVPGGFVGVDAFFVLSGYLISSILYRQAEKGSFTFRSFYERRAKRILPALVAVLLVSYVLAALLLTPRELRSFCAQALSTLAGASNIFFWRSTGYFDAHTELKPLLMTWSLGIEEQFYLVFPVLVFALYRRSRRVLLFLLALLSAASFVFSLYQTAHQPQTAFYMLPSRWWELGVGTLLGAYLPRYLARRSASHRAGLVNELLSVAGMLLLAGGIWLIRPTTPFPGLAAVPPVFGTALLIATEGSWINRRILSAAPIVSIGLVSYSWYLWHWPLLSLARNCANGNLPMLSACAISAVALLFAFASYYFVEQPFRQAPAHKRMLWKYAALSCGAALLPAVILALHGWPGRYPAADRIEAEARPPIDNPCLLLDGRTAPPQGPPCVPPKGTGTPVIAVVGDSHAGSLAAGVAEAAPAHGWALAQYTKVSCTPTGEVGVHTVADPQLAVECPAFFAAANQAIAGNPAIHTVVITGLWTDWVDPTHPARHYNPPGVDLSGTIPIEESYANLGAGLDEVVKTFVAGGKRVVLAMDVPEVPFDPLLRAVGRRIPARRAVGRLVSGHEDAASDFSHAPLDNELRVAAILKSVAAKDHAEYIDLSSTLCTRGRCMVEQDGRPFYFDNGHLSVLGAGYVLRGADIFH